MRRHGLSLYLLALVVACAQPPTKELSLTAERVARAEEAEASVYAPESFVAAESALAAARQRLQEGDYRAALEAASLASIRADEAYARALLGKQRMTRMARRQLQEILSLLEEAHSRGVPREETGSLDSLAERLGMLERELERGLAFSVQEEGTKLKDEALAFLNRLPKE